MGRDRILVPVANPKTARKLVHLASILAQASEDTSVCVLTIALAAPASRVPAGRKDEPAGVRQREMLKQIVWYAQSRNVPLYTKTRIAAGISHGILDEAERRGDVKLILMGWPGPLNAQTLSHNPANEVLKAARTNFAVLLDRGLERVRHILVPIGGGPHSRLALRLAYEIAEQEDAQITALRMFSAPVEAEEAEDRLLLLREIVEDELGSFPARITPRIAEAASVPEGILAEAGRQSYDLLVVGASEEWADPARLFGSVDDWVAQKVSSSVLLVRRYEPVIVSWLRRQAKKLDSDERNTDAPPLEDG